MSRKKPRWWLLGLMLLVFLVYLTWSWWIQEGVIRQVRVTQTAIAVILTSLGGLIWLVFFSALAWKKRLGTLAILVSAAVVFLAGFRVVGMTGDLVPVIEWRWGGDKVELGTLDPSQLTGLADYSQFQGPDRLARVPDPGLATDWLERPPELLWRQPIGDGWSAFAVTGSTAVTQQQSGESEEVVAFDLLSGRRLWSQAVEARYGNVVAGVGPRAVPTIAGGRVYTMGSTGILRCLDLEDGRLIWSHNVPQEMKTEYPNWGVSCSPLVLDDKVVVTAGGEGQLAVAYHTDDGRLLWQGGSDAAGYSSPQLRNFLGEEQILLLNAASITSHSPADGKVLWSHPWPSQQPNVAQPILLPGNRVFASSGYGVGGQMLQISRRGDRFQVEMLWKSPRMKSKFANLIGFEGSIYGLDDGVLVCLDPETGQRRWKRGRYGHGQMILVGRRLLLQAENGEVVLIEPHPEELRELTRFQALRGKTWNPPALAGRYLLVRNNREAACYRLPLAVELE